MSLEPDCKQEGLWVDPARKSDDPGTFAVIIGVSRYPHLAGGDRPASNTYGLGQLHVSALTAFRFFEWLRDEYYYISGSPPRPSPPARCWLLLSPTPAELSYKPEIGAHALEPTLVNCQRAILDWYRTMEGLPKAVAELSGSFFFFSGHGLEISEQHQLLLPGDYLEPASGTLYGALSTWNLAIGVKTLKVPNHFFLLDACRNVDDELRQLVNLKGTDILTEYPSSRYTRPPCCTPIFYASASGTLAWEPAHPSQGLSVFGQAILDGLEARGGLIPIRDPKVGVDKITVYLLDGYLTERVQQIAGQDQKDQYAVLGGSPINSWAAVTEFPATKAWAAVTEFPATKELAPEGIGNLPFDVSISAVPFGVSRAIPGSRRNGFWAPIGLATWWAILETWQKSILDIWWPLVYTAMRETERALHVSGSEDVPRVLMESARLIRLADGQELGPDEGYVIHQVARDAERSYRVEFSLTAERGNYWMELRHGGRAYALLLPDDRPEQAGYRDCERPRFRLEVNFAPGSGRISRLDLTLSDENPNLWLRKAATIAHLNQRATLPAILEHDDLRSLRAMLRGGVRSPLAALVAATVLLRAGRTRTMGPWLSELATRFPDLPDGAIYWAEYLLRANEEAALPFKAMESTLSLRERGLPLTNEALIYAMRQVDSYLLEPDLDSAARRRLESLQRQLGSALRLFRSGGLFCTFSASDAARLTPELVRPIARPIQHTLVPA